MKQYLEYSELNSDEKKLVRGIYTDHLKDKSGLEPNPFTQDTANLFVVKRQLRTYVQYCFVSGNRIVAREIEVTSALRPVGKAYNVNTAPRPKVRYDYT